MALVAGAISSGGPEQGAALQLASRLPGTDLTRTLADLLAKVQPPARIALLQCLAQRGDPAAMAAVAQQTDSPDPAVRLGSLTALGDLGDGSVALLLARKAATGSPAEKAAARQSLVNLRRGDVTSGILAPFATAAPDVQAELLRALGERGDQSADPKLLELAHSPSDETRAAALQALALLAGPDQIPPLVRLIIDADSDEARAEAVDALGAICQRASGRPGRLDARPVLDAVRNGPRAARVALLGVCVVLADAPARDALRGAATDPDPAVRDAAIHSICDSRDPELLPDMIHLAATTSDNKYRALAVRGCVRLAAQDGPGRFLDGQRIETFKSLLAAPLDAASKRQVLSGLGTVADGQALELALPLLNDPAVTPEAAQAVVQIAGPISGAEPETAESAINKVLAVTEAPDTAAQARAVLKQIRSGAGFITAWQMSGPYWMNGKDYSQLFDVVFPPEVNDGNQADWRILPVNPNAAQSGEMDLLQALGGEQRVAYGRTWLFSPHDEAATLELGSDDGIKVWLNGRLVHSNNTQRAVVPASDVVRVTLNTGWNPMMVKVTQNNLGWGFCVRCVGADGMPLPGLEASIHPKTLR